MRAPRRARVLDGARVGRGAERDRAFDVHLRVELGRVVAVEVAERARHRDRADGQAGVVHLRRLDGHRQRHQHRAEPAHDRAPTGEAGHDRRGDVPGQVRAVVAFEHRPADEPDPPRLADRREIDLGAGVGEQQRLAEAFEVVGHQTPRALLEIVRGRGNHEGRARRRDVVRHEQIDVARAVAVRAQQRSGAGQAVLLVPGDLRFPVPGREAHRPLLAPDEPCDRRRHVDLDRVLRDLDVVRVTDVLHGGRARLLGPQTFGLPRDDPRIDDAEADLPVRLPVAGQQRRGFDTSDGVVREERGDPDAPIQPVAGRAGFRPTASPSLPRSGPTPLRLARRGRRRRRPRRRSPA